MRNLNSVLIEGNLTSDPDERTVGDGTRLCRFSIAYNRMYKTADDMRDEVSFFDVEVWGDRAAPCIDYLQKGKKVRVIGRLKQDRWETAEGSRRERISIVAEHVEFGPGARQAPQEKS